jgi:hypothetical protein
MKKVIGYYNELEYRIELDGKEIYTAGNSPFDSQQYTSKENGVGLIKMKQYCEVTAKDLAKEHNANLIGIEYLEITE